VAVSAGVYLLNDVLDADADRAHPDKRHRPVASGDLAAPLAVACGCLLVLAGVAGSWLLAGTAITLVVGVYVVLNAGYSLGAKRIPVVELAFVASGFVLRAGAGGAAVHLAISPWFLMVTSAGALFVVAGKRSSELAARGTAGRHRAVLGSYPPAFLRSVRVVALSVAVVSYVLWAFGRAPLLDLHHGDADDVVFRLSIVPFVGALLATELAFETGRGEAPEDLALGDRSLQWLGALWLALVAFGIYT
jgi:decaprenyl-phosphate phosphoribosyltransferase